MLAPVVSRSSITIRTCHNHRLNEQLTVPLHASVIDITGSIKPIIINPSIGRDQQASFLPLLTLQSAEAVILPHRKIRWLVHWPLMDGLLHLVQRGGDWDGPQPAQAPPRCTKCNSSPINGQCTNHRSGVHKGLINVYCP